MRKWFSIGTKKRLAALIGAAAVGALCLAGVWASREGEALLEARERLNRLIEANL